MKKINVDEKLVKHVAMLARIELDEKKIAEFQANLTDILQHVEELNEVNVDSVKPMFTPLENFIEVYKEKLSNEFKQRIDNVRPSLNVKEVLKNAPDQQDQQFKIHAVIEDE
ncbi:MAG: Asp-tRNA(Asn)/Glu-tRNA(Gln) amidotransferase subunit GatC [Halobacteriovoraceae bacterium]|nr:Asp-tRNA(Asn)/Glu-tRNA(Gln) amidotransferase subunit GatC [Halobacteriovoraceae bacterium]